MTFNLEKAIRAIFVIANTVIALIDIFKEWTI